MASQAESRDSVSRAAKDLKGKSHGATGQAVEGAGRGDEMRIVGGEFRGRPLATPRSQSIRPTTDRTREAVFNVLSHRFPEKLEGVRVLDLFAGTGALGIEALSRGAAHCLFVEESAEGRGLIRTNVEAFGLQGRTKIFKRDATGLGDAGTIAPFGLVFADPPYNRGLGEVALRSALRGGWLLSGALCVVEEAASAHFAPGEGFSVVDERSYGDTVIRFIEAVGAV
jgi:16S rRNA (guanine966-N2)-methyltransferase